MRRGADAIDIDVRVACSSGTYIRALARDLGEDLGVGGHLTALCRTRVGPFAVSDAVPVASRERDAPVDPALAARLLSPAAVADAVETTVVEDFTGAQWSKLVIDWFVWVQVIVALLAGLLCVGVVLAGRAPNDLTVFVLALVEVLLLAQVVIAIIAPLAGNPPTGDLLEFWVYLVTAVLIPPAATLWALVARSRWSTAILAAAAFAIAITLLADIAEGAGNAQRTALCIAFGGAATGDDPGDAAAGGHSRRSGGAGNLRRLGHADLPQAGDRLSLAAFRLGLPALAAVRGTGPPDAGFRGAGADGGAKRPAAPGGGLGRDTASARVAGTGAARGGDADPALSLIHISEPTRPY